MNHRTATRARALRVLAGLLLCTLGSAALAQDRIKIRAASLTLPVVNPVIVNVMKERGLDSSNGLDLEIKPYPSIAAFYAALATDDVDMLIGGPTVLQKLRNEGVPVKLVATALRLSDLVIATMQPSIKSLADLKGKQLAADMGSQQYQIVAIYAHAKGLALGSDVTVVQASFALARSQLAAGRVDAAMVIEPIATMMLNEMPAPTILFNGSTAWRELTGKDGWELVAATRGELIQRNPTVAKKLIAALRDFQALIREDVDAVDQIAVRTVKLPPGVLKQAVMSKRWEFDIQPAWGDERPVINDMFARAVTAKFQDKVPPDDIFYVP